MDVEVRSFEEDVIQASYKLPIVVDFWAGWCAPCQILGPVLEKLADQADGAWWLAKVDMDANPDVSQAHGISGIPAVKLFHEGKEIAQFAGALPEPQVAQWLDEHLPSESKQAVAEARATIAAGDLDSARTKLEGVVGDDPGNLDARIELATLVFEEDAESAVDLVAEAGPEHEGYDRVSAIRTLHRL
ncbi:MAG: thioredoxin domain-containing protein, partial [Candidatus Latescibacteria bacterium]|nr:thioredoxin domain-containing protein [Candidatus Latescibacterota bacterium]